MIIGYARVSTSAQDLTTQRDQLQAAGCKKVFEEKASGVRSDRPQLARAIRALWAGDVLMVTRLDRLARSQRDLLNTLAAIGEKGAAFRSLADAWADTTTPHGRLIVAVLGGLAEFERDLIRSRTNEGRQRAKAEGRRLGRKPALDHFQRRRALDMLAEGKPGADVARLFDVSEATISRLKPEVRIQ